MKKAKPLLGGNVRPVAASGQLEKWISRVPAKDAVGNSERARLQPFRRITA
jgi:hypothetical protein